MRATRLRVVVPVALATLLAALALVGALVNGDRTDTPVLPTATVDGAASGAEGFGRESALGLAEADKAAGAGGPGGGQTWATLPPAASLTQHYLIRNGSITLTVKRHGLRDVMQRVGAITLGMGGYVLSSHVGSDTPGVGPVVGLPGHDGAEPAVRPGDDPTPAMPHTQPGDSSDDVVRYGTITVRIPETRFDAAVERFAKLGEIVDMTTSADDVTDQMVDLRARLRHARAVERRLLGFLDRAKTIRETLAVQDRIHETQLTIEQLRAEITRLSEVTSYGTITLSLRERGVPQPGTIDESDTFWGALTHSLRLIADGARAGAVAFGAALPFLVLATALFVVVSRVRRSLGRRRPPQAPATPAAPAAQG